VTRCHFCKAPLALRSCVRPGGLPFYWWACGCDDAELARPIWTLRITSFEDVVAAARAFPESVRFVLARVTP